MHLLADFTETQIAAEPNKARQCQAVVIQYSHGVLCRLHPGPSVDPYSDTSLQGRGALPGSGVVLVQRASAGGPRAGGASNHSAGT